MSLDIQIMQVWPVLAPALAAVLILIVDIVRPHLRLIHGVVALLGLLGGAVASALALASDGAAQAFCLDGGHCLYDAGQLGSGLQLLALGVAVIVVVLSWSQWMATDADAAVPTALVLAATAGVTAVAAATDLGTLLVSIELATLPVIALVALDRRAERAGPAIDGAVALLTTSLVSFALMAIGAALWVAATGTVMLGPGSGTDFASLEALAQSLISGAAGERLHTLALVFLLAGIAYKLSAAPFHAWTPVTYAAAPLPVTIYLAGVSKVAALGGIVLVVVAAGPQLAAAASVIAVLAAVSMTLGNVMALRQEDAVALLAWSAVAQAGWVLLPLVALTAAGASAAGGYLAVYVVATVLAFTIVLGVAGLTGRTDLEAFRGMLHERPWAAIALLAALLSLAGLPPAIVGLVAKVVALEPVAAGGHWWLAVVAALNVALGIAVYLRWLRVVVTMGPARQSQTASAAKPTWPRANQAIVLFLTALLVAGSVAPIGIW